MQKLVPFLSFRGIHPADLSDLESWVLNEVNCLVCSRVKGGREERKGERESKEEKGHDSSYSRQAARTPE